ncbi:hypothetical protein [Aeromonas veronii]|uniref:hypothetical protein n=1 Tax=Aeromonas veronii TaxID=654 RepID=UPI00058A19B7|nr:hypothetical protein [Aeromonas veronii]
MLSFLTDYSDLIIKSGSFLIALLGVAPIIRKWLLDLDSKRKDDYRFAREFFSDLDKNPSMHPFVREKGYLAIAGKSHVNEGEVSYILSLKEPSKALGNYKLAKGIVWFDSEKSLVKISYKKWYKYKFVRIVAKAYHIIKYGVFFFLAILPLYSNSFREWIGDALILYVFLFSPICMFIAVRSIIEKEKIVSAEYIVKNQESHTKIIKYISGGN